MNDQDPKAWTLRAEDLSQEALDRPVPGPDTPLQCVHHHTSARVLTGYYQQLPTLDDRLKGRIGWFRDSQGRRGLQARTVAPACSRICPGICPVQTAAVRQ